MKSLLFTGSSGFLGSNILLKLKEQYIVDTLDVSNKSTYCVNLSEKIPNIDKKYDIILHAAGKAHTIPKNEKEEEEFYKINLQGTKNLCISFEKHGIPETFIFISTVAVYGCESGEGIKEDHPLNAVTPYGKSKIMAEEYLIKWCNKNNVNLTIIRPSLLAGKNPPGNLGSMIKGISSGKYLSINGRKARKSLAMAYDIERLIPYCEGKSGIYNLCDDNNPSFKELEELISKQLNKPIPLNIPMWLAKCIAKTGDYFNFLPVNSYKLKKITQSLTFSNEKIKKELKFFPSDVLTNFKI